MTKYIKITYPDVNNGLGCRVTLWVSGCNHHCIGCHNPESWDFEAGTEFAEIMYMNIIELCSKNYIDGLTICGGEPLDPKNLSGLKDLLSFLKKNRFSKDIWCYTGYTWENLTKSQKEIVRYMDILIDGLYEKDKRDTSLAFRGSSNQRIIDIQKSLETNEVITLKI